MKHRRGGGRAGIELLSAYNVLTVVDLAGQLPSYDLKKSH